MLNVWAGQGSGKTSLIEDVFWPLFGVPRMAKDDSIQTGKAKKTEFTMMKTLSVSNSIPIVLDEFKTSAFNTEQLNLLFGELRDAFDGKKDARGNRDQSMTEYYKLAPICIMGEHKITTGHGPEEEGALLERFLFSSPEKSVLSLKDSKYKAAMTAIVKATPNRLAFSIIKFMLNIEKDVEKNLKKASKIIDECLGDRVVPERIRKNLTVMALGIIHYQEYANSLGVKLPQINLKPTVVKMLNKQLLGSNGETVKDSFDSFLETLSTLVINGKIHYGDHYVVTDDGMLAIHFSSCHAIFSEYCKRAGFSSEALNVKALKRQIEANFERKGYVKCADQRTYFKPGRDRRRAVIIDPQAMREQLEVDGFGEDLVRPKAIASNDNKAQALNLVNF